MRLHLLAVFVVSSTFAGPACGVAAIDVDATSSVESDLGGIAPPGKFLGNLYYPGDTAFGTYWNQTTPEFSGKWRWVEPTRGQMDWSVLDEIYAYADARGIPVKYHGFVWGIDIPDWVAGLSANDQLAELEEFMRLLFERYPQTAFVDVVNEPLHQPPAYMGALGGTGATGWDWVIAAYAMARRHAPATTKLLINEFDIEEDAYAMASYIELIRLLQERGLIDGVGLQCHWLEASNAQTIKLNLGSLAKLGLPIYVSELDLGGVDDADQLHNYQTLFPVLWQHPAVAGVTLWGYRQNGIYRSDAHLVRADGTDRPALGWLRQYVASAVSPPASASPWSGDGVTAGWIDDASRWLGVVSRDKFWIKDLRENAWIAMGHLSEAWQDAPSLNGAYPWTGDGVTAGWIDDVSRIFGVISRDKFWTLDLTTNAWTGTGYLSDAWSSAPPLDGAYPWTGEGVTAGWIDDVSRVLGVVSRDKYWTLDLTTNTWTGKAYLSDAWSSAPLLDGAYPWTGEGVTAGWIDEESRWLGVVSRDRFWILDLATSTWIGKGYLSEAWKDAPSIDEYGSTAPADAPVGWGPCPDGQIASDGHCVALGCTGRCVVGARRCPGVKDAASETASAYQTCGDRDDDGCTEWLLPVTLCPRGEVCQAGKCVSVPVVETETVEGSTAAPCEGSTAGRSDRGQDAHSKARDDANTDPAAADSASQDPAVPPDVTVVGTSCSATGAAGSGWGLSALALLLLPARRRRLPTAGAATAPAPRPSGSSSRSGGRRFGAGSCRRADHS